MFKIDKVIQLGVDELKEWGENPVKRGEVPDNELRKSLEDNGLAADTIAVVPNGKGYLVIDGNRRLRIAKELGLEGKFLAKVYSKGVDVIALAIALNGTGRAWDRQAYTQFVANHPERLNILPRRYRVTTRRMYELLGKDYEWFSLNCRPNAFDWGEILARYLMVDDDSEKVKEIVMWVGRWKLTREVRKAIDTEADKAMIKRAILKDAPLRIIVTSV